VYIFYSGIFSSRGFAPPNILDDWLVSASWLRGLFTVRGFNCNFGLVATSAETVTFISNYNIKISNWHAD
jgi:hypothetical protein